MSAQSTAGGMTSDAESGVATGTAEHAPVPVPVPVPVGRHRTDRTTGIAPAAVG